jgi:hypothetical protein
MVQSSVWLVNCDFASSVVARDEFPTNDSDRVTIRNMNHKGVERFGVHYRAKRFECHWKGRCWNFGAEPATHTFYTLAPASCDCAAWR